MKAALAFALALVAGPVAALTPAPACEVDPESQRFYSFGEAPAGAYVLEAWPQQVANGFVATSVHADGAAMQFLHHCPTDQYLIVITPESSEDRVLGRFDDMMTSEQSCTMRQIADEMGALGGFTRMGQGDIGRCDCRAAGLD
ncbi:hypothetical protein [Wenxinia marina]|uniref:Uncharacterized protein n=1 Tax=Wenxinia marina DSM 24838 TaxID=1123501 RepID=A0A0D0Q5W5_9RHOB|nr:hypothetical protein [Wenxinia marina]KIQ69869.1 hypothetical protein Wenmar_01439 [Wenxinia marina DSM 24838]GGL61829.1 hypothetical protein GCM10011392_15420 [Wenxinia marina]